mgnify:CR=1 FL=1
MNWPEDIEKYGKHYSDGSFWKKLMKHAKKLGAKTMYMALLLFYAWQSEGVTNKERAMIVGALGYLMLPVDLIPDFIPIAGFVDDFSALVAAYKVVKGNISDGVRASARNKMAEWFGDVDFAGLDRQVEQAAEEEPDDQ